MADVNIASAAFKARAHEFYARLRQESPVHTVKLPDRRTAYLITRYDDVAAALKDERFAKDRLRTLTEKQLAKQPWMPGIFRPVMKNMLDQDPPNHTRLRALVQKAFTPRMVEELRGRVETIVNQLLDAAQRRGGMDAVWDFAVPLPTTIIAEMLGIPERDRGKFHRWTNAMLASTSSRWGMAIALAPGIALLRYVRRLLELRRAEPADDLVTAVVRAEEAGDKLDADEAFAMIFLLLVAGHETTVNLIGNGTLALLEHPEQLERLRREPALMKTAVEELLRYDGPLETATERFARENLTVAGTTIPAGSLVLAVLASANRDERQFARPDELDIAREDNKHVAFGLGIHYCLGAPLARLEAQVAFTRLLERCPKLVLAVRRDRVRWKRGMILRGLASLPVTF